MINERYPRDGFYRLCERIERIDAEAARWLRNDAEAWFSARACGGFEKSPILIECFLWTHSPQGFQYWNRIAFELGDQV